MMEAVVPRVAIGVPLLIIPIFLIIGLFIFAVVKSGKGKGLWAVLGVLGLIAVVLALLLPIWAVSVQHRAQPARLPDVRTTSNSA
ncbi:MAG: hypothetical protein V3R81_03610, partial [Gammaproteobacteria bacterium]